MTVECVATVEKLIKHQSDLPDGIKERPDYIEKMKESYVA